MQTIVDKMARHICDNLCIFPHTIVEGECLEEKCAECEMGEFICSILNQNEADRAAGEALKTVIREKIEKLTQEIEGISRVKESLPVIDGYYVDGRYNEMIKFRAWLERLLPQKKKIPEIYKNHITTRFEKVE